MEEALWMSREQVRLALAAARMVAWAWDPAADTIVTTENLADIYGVARLEAAAQGFALVHPDDLARHEAAVRQAMATGGSYQSIFRITRLDTGEVVWLEERGVAVLDDAGAVQKLTGVVMDVSVCAEPEQRRQAASLARVHDATGASSGAVAVFQDIGALKDPAHAREEFLSSAAHDLKTPLTSIRGHAQLARRRLARLNVPDLAPIAGHLAQIDVNVSRLLDLINELEDVTRAQLGQTVTLDRQPTDLLALVRGVVAQHEGLTAHRLRVETILATLEAVADAARVERVVGNLLSNALKYSPRGGDITLRVAQEEGPAGSVAVITVQDQGIGIPMADLPHIFERFRRARNVVGQIPGTGIGLASVQQIVAEHGGTISVDSQEGKGSTFTVRLPLAAPPDGGTEAKKGEHDDHEHC